MKTDQPNLKTDINKRAHLLTSMIGATLSGQLQAKANAMLKGGATPDQVRAFIARLAPSNSISIDTLLVARP